MSTKVVICHMLGRNCLSLGGCWDGDNLHIMKSLLICISLVGPKQFWRALRSISVLKVSFYYYYY